MKRLFFTLIAVLLAVADTHAVLKEKDLDQTLEILRTELTERHRELAATAQQRRQANQQVITQLMETMRQANQNALMLYSQQQQYVFDLTYACHQATEQYQQFQRRQLPFRSFISQSEEEIAKYDSLVTSLKSMPRRTLSDRAQINRNVCLTLAASIRNTLQQNQEQMSQYLDIYERTEQRLKTLNDYAQLRYNDIQTSIFRNGSENYFSRLRHLFDRWHEMVEVLQKKYNFNSLGQDEIDDRTSQWSLVWILGLFVVILIYILIAAAINQLVFRYLLPRRLKTPELRSKQSAVLMAATTITFAIIMGVMTSTSGQNFLVMASNLLVEFAWLMGVVLISLLLRVDGTQVKSAFRIYAPLLVVTFIVIAFRIVLIPSEMVNMVFPAVLLFCTVWQWQAIRRHHHFVPRSDMFYTYISLVVFIFSLCCSWAGYTLLSVQVLIWWTMQLTCILTITCLSQYVRKYGERHGFENRPVTKSWFYLLLYRVMLPTLSVLSVMLSIYWAADVFNLSDLCWRTFNKDFVDLENLKLSIMKLTIVICLWFLFRYLVQTILALMRQHYQATDPSTAASREVMGKNVVQVLIWGIWLLLSLSLLHISMTWLLAISGGLSTGIGFASKEIIENIYYGASLMAGRIKVGDWIEVDGTMGKVSSISYTSTIVESLYGEVITFQNSQLFSKNYKNLTKNHGYILAPVEFSVAYGSDLAQVTQLVEHAVNDMHHQWIDPDRRTKLVVSEMADSSIDFKLFVWADAPCKAYVVSDVLKCVYDTLNRNNIEIPFPQRDIHIKQ